MTQLTDCFEGGCTCGHVRYRIGSKPLIVHCCHCSWCQRETGSAFVLNALIEYNRVELLSGEVSVIDTPTHSSKGQSIARCPNCQVALWSHYKTFNQKITFVRVGTLDKPATMPPDIHIYTRTKQPWLVLPANIPTKTGGYAINEIWSEESLQRKAILNRCK